MRNVEFSEVSQAVESALDRLQGLQPRDSVEAAERLGELLNRAISDVALVRARAAAKLRDDGNLSLAQLAELLHISRGRAAQLVRAAEAKSGVRGRNDR